MVAAEAALPEDKWAQYEANILVAAKWKSPQSMQMVKIGAKPEWKAEAYLKTLSLWIE